jgi:F-type H+-transporting ATPase subunit gamma
MPENIKSLRRRIRSIKNTKQITRAMEMVSAAKLRRAEETLRAARPYSAKLQEVLGRLAGSPAVAAHPLAEVRPVKKRLLILMTGDRGLAGAFNTSIIKVAESRLEDKNSELYSVGRKGTDYFRSRPVTIVGSITDLGGKISAERMNEVADEAMRRFLSGEVDEVEILYNSFVSTLVYRSTTERLLPLTQESLLAPISSGKGQKAVEIPAKGKAANTEYLLEPSTEQVLEVLLPRFVRSKVYMCQAESLTAEYSARMVAMSNATKNCAELIDALSLRMNKARQANITTEIIEVVSGAQALKG